MCWNTGRSFRRFTYPSILRHLLLLRIYVFAATLKDNRCLYCFLELLEYACFFQSLLYQEEDRGIYRPHDQVL